MDLEIFEQIYGSKSESIGFLKYETSLLAKQEHNTTLEQIHTLELTVIETIKFDNRNNSSFLIENFWFNH